MKKKVKIAASVIIAGALIFGGMNITKNKSADAKNTEGALSIENAADQVPVTVETVKKGAISDELYTIGQAAPSSTYSVNAKTSGEVSGVYFDVGDRVRKGDTLFTIDMANFNTDMDKNITQLTNSVQQAKTKLDNDTKTYNDKQKLFESGAVSNYDLDNSKIAYENSKIAYDNAVKNLESSRSTYSENRDNYVMKSPVNGVVTERTIENGMHATSQNGFTIIVKDNMVIEASVSSKYINNVKPGQKASIYVNTLERSYKGHVSSVSYDSKKGSYPVKIDIEDNDKRIQPGMYSEISINTGSKGNALLIPKESILSQGAVDYVYTIDESNVAHKKTIETGISNNGTVEIVKGLAVDEKVVMEGKEFLDEGKLVMIQ